MVEKRNCSFCGNPIEPGTGRMYVKKDGTIYHFCKNKCTKNMTQLKRNPRRVTWTKQYAQEKEAILLTTGKKDEGKKKKKKKADKPAKKADEKEDDKDTKPKKTTKKKTTKKKTSKKKTTSKADDKADKKEDKPKDK